MLDVPLAIYASSLEQTSSARSEFSLHLANCGHDFHSAGRVWNVFTTNSSTKDLYRIIVLAIISIPPMIGTSSDDVFCSSSSHSFSSDFWKHFIVDHPLDSKLSSLRNEGLQTDLAPLHSVGLSPLLSPSLASGIGSLRYVYEAWKTGNLSRATLRDISSTESCNTYFSSRRLRIPWLRLRGRSWLLSEGHTGFFFGARFGCVYWLFLDFFFQVTARALTVSINYESAPGPFAAEGRCFIHGGLALYLVR